MVIFHKQKIFAQNNINLRMALLDSNIFSIAEFWLSLNNPDKGAMWTTKS